MPLLTRPHPCRSDLLSRAVATVDPTALALARTGAGVMMVARPTALPRLLGVDSAASARLGWTVQMLGAREIALGAGTLAARRGDRRAARLWIAAGAFSDAMDVLAVGGALLRGRVGKPAGVAAVLTALGAAAIGVRGLGETD